ncbi:hypothetical protein QN412_19345 [Pseudomonas sp. RTB3]|uniref:hypothetical protein n=1 Tax=unclassified Pseudomonas TaxID=196821 RepID=UPI002B222D9A|nr:MULTISPECIES: hypothetical protein [unclassified Pseudomonas]MEB0005160.1 hypothetical protein [Pseudomonas sp. RTB2]MEB0019085.1 hypothetical protein [Pseudomonas sp. RTB3]MEB0271143.1 hypothetical protein [Pseudomonas sp. 5B4]
MNKPPQNSAQMPDYLKARKLHLSGIMAVIADMKKLNLRANKGGKVEALTIAAIKAELDFIDLQLKRKGR